MVEHWESCECRKCDQKRIADLRAEVERLREALRQGRDYHTYRFTIQKRDGEIADLLDMIERLRSLLYKTTHTLSVQCNFAHLYNGAPCGECEACEHIKQVYQDSREALEGGGDDE